MQPIIEFTSNETPFAIMRNCIQAFAPNPKGGTDIFCAGDRGDTLLVDEDYKTVYEMLT